MPPKGQPSAPGVSMETFLAACIKHGKEKLTVDFERVAAEVGLSAGGAANKYRAWIKKMESEGATWAKSDAGSDTGKNPAPGKRKASTKSTKSTLKPESGNEKDGGTAITDIEAEVEQPAKKKTRAVPNRNQNVSVVVKSQVKQDDDEDSESEATPKKNAAAAKAKKNAASNIAKKRAEKKKAPAPKKESSEDEVSEKEAESEEASGDSEEAEESGN